MSIYRVTEGTQVNHEGQLHEGGTTVEADAETAAPWLLAGWVTEANGKASTTTGA